ncbi:MAG: SDR family NAD(P)-dependent oxidoreductase [Bacteroidota bacterium]
MILVTGGTGLLGSHLLLELVREHEEVVAVKRASSDMEEVKRVFARHSGEAEALFKLIDWVDIDLANQADVEGAMTDIDQVYHCAAMVSFNPGDANQMIDFNVTSTENIVNACLATGVKRLVHVSSSSAIGRSPEGEPADETMIWARSKKHTAYSVSKFKSEMEVWRGMEEGLEAVIVNPTIIIGAGFWNNGSSAMFSRVAKGLRFGTPGMTGYVGVQDVVSAMTRLMASDISGERFILSAGDHTYAEILKMIAGALGVPRKMKLVTPSMLHALSRMDALKGFLTGKRSLTLEQVKAAFNRAGFSSNKVREAIGFEFTPVHEVIQRVAEFYRADHPK